MKNKTPKPAPFSSWRPLALASIAVNVVLALFLIRDLGRAHFEATSPAVGTAASTWPRELSPYAALGSFMAENNRIPDLGWNAAQFRAFLDGLRASYEGRGLPLNDEAKRLRDDVSQRVQAMLARDQPNPVEEYFRILRDKEGATRTTSGLHYRITEPGAGSKAKPEDIVVVSFAARLPDGTALPSLTQVRTRVVVRDLLPGLAEGVQLLSVGGKALIYLPPALAFAEENRPPQIPNGAPLGFFVELHDIVAAGK